MLANRIAGVFKLSVPTFEEIEHDPGATSQAVLIVAIVTLLSTLGAGITDRFGGLHPSTFSFNIITTLIWTLAGWFLWSVVSYFVGTALFSGKATVKKMLRMIGFAYAPQMLSIIPCIGSLVGFVWSLAAGFIAVRQGLNLNSWKALLTIAAGFLVYLIGTMVIKLNLVVGVALRLQTLLYFD